MKINIYGSTGIIGSKSLLLIQKHFPTIKINLLCCNNNVKKLIYQCKTYNPKYVYINNLNKIEYLKRNINSKIIVFSFKELQSYLNDSESDYSILAISGYSALYYFESIINNTKSLGLVNKEVIVSCGHLLKNFNSKKRKKIYPLDSEHFSIFKNLNNSNIKSLKNITLTASGGPFLGKKYNSLKSVTFKQASTHPKWKMGYKNSIDSATMSNKCLELIEAHYLFNIPFEKLKIIIHPESQIHSIFEFENYLYNFNTFHNDMTIPIYHFLNQNYNFIHVNNNFSLKFNQSYNFIKINKNQFPIYSLFNKLDKSKPANLIKFNIANEFAVNYFRRNLIKYTDIYKIVEKITSLNLKYKLNNIKDIIKYHENYEKKINEKFNPLF